MSDVILTAEVYSPSTRVIAFQSDLLRAPSYWRNLLSCTPVDGGAGAVAWVYRLGRRTLEGTATARIFAPTRLRVDLHGGIRGSLTAEYRRTAMTRTQVVLRADVRIHHGLLGLAVDRAFASRQLVADARQALDGLATLLGAETSSILGAMACDFDLPPQSRSAGVTILGLDAAAGDPCAGPRGDRSCSRDQSGSVAPCAGRRMIPSRAEGLAGWTLDVRAGAQGCPLAWLLPHEVVLTA